MSSYKAHYNEVDRNNFPLLLPRFAVQTCSIYEILILLTFLLHTALIHAKSNLRFESYSGAKWYLYNHVYHDHRVTLYCDAEYDQDRNVFLPEGFEIPDHYDRPIVLKQSI